MVLNVEYNQLDPLLRASGYPDGDVNDPTTGYSPFPGNINQVISLPSSFLMRPLYAFNPLQSLLSSIS